MKPRTDESKLKRTPIWRSEKTGAFLAVLVLNSVLLLLLGSMVIYHFVSEKVTDTRYYVPTTAKVTPPPKPPQTSGGKGAKSLLDPTINVVPPPSSTSQIVTSVTSTTSFNVQATTDVSMTELPSFSTAQGSSLSSDAQGQGAVGVGNSLFGVTNSNGAPMLSGDLYDMKQTPDHVSTGMNPKKWLGILQDFVKGGWNDDSLSRYYKTKNPLFTDMFAISTRPSGAAPKAFSVENEVQPGMWMVHYHGKVIPPQTGDFRFAGFADNVIVVRIDGHLVFDGGWSYVTSDAQLHDTFPNEWSPFYSGLHQGTRSLERVGKTFHLTGGAAVDMDVLIGDDGGSCSFFLLLMDMQGNYEKLADGTPKLPFFQITAKAAPTFTSKEEHPPFTTTTEPWTATN